LSKKRPGLNFEEALSELETLVERMEQGELSLEESLRTFERGVELTRACQQALDEAQQRVEVLTRKDDSIQPQPFRVEDE
jgi:exodeoxyribonuclease VII small subunit